MTSESTPDLSGKADAPAMAKFSVWCCMSEDSVQYRICKDHEGFSFTQFCPECCHPIRITFLGDRLTLKDDNCPIRAFSYVEDDYYNYCFGQTKRNNNGSHSKKS
jgi:hypothetical protein